MVHHLTDIAAMYASRAAEAGLIMRERTKSCYNNIEIQKQNELHKDTINTLTVRLEEFVSVHILCSFLVWCILSFYLSPFLDLTLIHTYLCCLKDS